MYAQQNKYIYITAAPSTCNSVYINLSSPWVTTYATYSDIKTLRILPHNVLTFHIITTLNTNVLLKQLKPVVLKLFKETLRFEQKFI